MFSLWLVRFTNYLLKLSVSRALNCRSSIITPVAMERGWLSLVDEIHLKARLTPEIFYVKKQSGTVSISSDSVKVLIFCWKMNYNRKVFVPVRRDARKKIQSRIWPSSANCQTFEKQFVHLTFQHHRVSFWKFK